MHILHYSVGGHPIPAIYGGAVQQTIEELSKAFVAHDHKVTVITATTYKKKRELQMCDTEGVEYKYVLSKSENKGVISRIKAVINSIREIFRSGPYDVVNVHIPHFIPLFKILSPFIGKPNIFGTFIIFQGSHG